MTEDNIKMVFEEVVCKDGMWMMQMVQDHVQWQTSVLVVLNFQFLLPQKQLNIQTIQATAFQMFINRLFITKNNFYFKLTASTKESPNTSSNVTADTHSDILYI
jgi:hypothetical protein